jgi:hypothetical protein
LRFENTGLEKFRVDLNKLDEILPKHGLIRAGQWDYERVTYDRKFDIKEGIYYLRVQGYATEGDVGAHDAYIQLMKPILGKYYYPHGVEYGDDEYFPERLVEKCNQILEEVKKDLEPFNEA